MNISRFALATTMLALAACADSGPLPSAPDQASLSVGGEPTFARSISGNADVDTPFIPNFQPGGLRRMVIQARKEADGPVSGKLTIRQEWEGGATLEANVTCLGFVGNRARVGAELTSINGVPTTNFVALQIIMVDNGEGENAAPDQSSQARVTSNAEELQSFCNYRTMGFEVLDLVRGNLQIR